MIGFADEGCRRFQLPTDMWGISNDRRLASQRPDGQHQPAGGQQHRDLGVLRQRRSSNWTVPAADFGTLYSAQFLENITINSNKEFQQKYVAAGGRNAKFRLPAERHPQLELLGIAAAADET